MNKILLTLILAVFIVGTISAIGFGLVKSDFKDKVKKLDPNLLCEKLKNSDGTYKLKKCKDNMEKINIDDSIISITKNKDGVIMVE